MSLQTHGVRLRDVATVGVAGLTLCYPLLALWYRREAVLPPVSWVVSLFVLAGAVGVVSAGRRVRATVRQTAKQPVEPLVAFRILRFAQACALTGAGVAGGYLALVLVALPDSDAASVRGAVIAAGAVAVSGIVLAAMGLWAQSMCRIDPDDDNRGNSSDLDDDDSPSSGSPAFPH